MRGDRPTEPRERRAARITGVRAGRRLSFGWMEAWSLARRRLVAALDPRADRRPRASSRIFGGEGNRISPRGARDRTVAPHALSATGRFGVSTRVAWVRLRR